MKKNKNKNINSTTYWQNRFDNNWVQSNGESQSSYFMKLILNNLPEQITKSKPKTICDVGMSLGAGTEILTQHFTDSYVFGIDFTENAHILAKQLHPNCNFQNNKLSENVDMVVSSNVLEHTDDYMSEIIDLLKYTNNTLVILVPFKEDVENVIPEHNIIFDEINDFPETINEFKRTYIKEIDISQDGFWCGSQLLVVYEKDINKNI